MQQVLIMRNFVMLDFLGTIISPPIGTSEEDFVFHGRSIASIHMRRAGGQSLEVWRSSQLWSQIIPGNVGWSNRLLGLMIRPFIRASYRWRSTRFPALGRCFLAPTSWLPGWDTSTQRFVVPWQLSSGAAELDLGVLPRTEMVEMLSGIRFVFGGTVWFLWELRRM